jgi:beta-lactamase superfamily II metal-dependent hydrolase
MKDNPFERYRKGKELRGGRIQEINPTLGWITITLLVVFNFMAWPFAVTGYHKMIETGGKPDTTGIYKSSNEESSTPVHPGTLLTERKPDELAVVFLDVGQGDAIFLRTPTGENILVDSGEGSNPDNKFARSVGSAQELILPFFRQNRIEELDYFITTHPHSDHIGSSYEVIQNTSIEEVWAAGYNHPSRSKKDMLKAIESKQSTSELPFKVPEGAGGTLQDGMKLDLGTGTRGWLLRTKPDAENTNEASLVLLFYYGETGILLTGDAEHSGEKELIKKWGKQLDVEILKAGHHGSRSSSIPPFVETVQPDHSIMMVGHYNSFGHPSDEVLSRLKRAGSAIHRTDEDGTIFMFTDGRSIRVHKEPAVSAVND